MGKNKENLGEMIAYIGTWKISLEIIGNHSTFIRVSIRHITDFSGHGLYDEASKLQNLKR